MKNQEESKYKIYIDTANRESKKVTLVSIAGDKEEVIGERKGEIDVNDSIRDILSENKITLNDIVEFIPNLGPGSFTGLKIGVTIANIFNWILGRKKLENLDTPQYGGEPNISERKEKNPL